MTKHTIILGHGSGDPGAIGVRKTERQHLEDIGRELQTLINTSGLRNSVQIISDHNVYKHRTISRYRGTTVTELHFNAHSPSAHGMEVLIKKGFEADAMDKRILKALSGYWFNRGFKQRDNLYNMNVAANLGINYRLIEFCFITNANDSEILVKYMKDISHSLLEAITGRRLSSNKPAENTTIPPSPKPKPSPKPSGYTGGSIVDYLKSVGVDSGFSNRVKLAKQYGISGYSGSPSQNVELLNKMRSGSAPKPPKKSSYTGNSIVDYLKSVGIDSGFGNRAKLARQYGISGYSGSPRQNMELLNKMRG